MGAAILAMVEDGAYASIADACSHIVKVVETIEPDPALTALYDARYQEFRQLYPALKDFFGKLAGE